MAEKTVRGLDLVMYSARKRHFGIQHARDLTIELKGNDLLSRRSFQMLEKYGTSTNHSLTDQVISTCIGFRDKHPIYLFGAAVFGEKSILRNIGNNRLSRPLADILDKVSAASTHLNERRNVHLVFDGQICGAEPNIAASVRRFVAGVKLKNISHYPLVGVSHVMPGIQLADIIAFILGRHAVGDGAMEPWFKKLLPLEWAGQINGFDRRGFQRWEKNATGNIVVRHLP